MQNCSDVLVRIHSECLTGDVFGSKRCDCGEQLDHALRAIEKEGKGVCSLYASRRPWYRFNKIKLKPMLYKSKVLDT